MPMPRVWTEREVGSWDACVYASGLMLLVAGGKTTYPLGIYTGAEREALEASDDRPDETGANFGTLDVAVRRRYGVTLHRIADGSRAGVAAALGVPGFAYAIAGRLANFPLGHSLRRYSPGFTGSHAVCVVPLGAGLVHWLDPLAANLYAGERVTVEQVLTFAHYPNDARYLYAEELSPMTTVTLTPFVPTRPASFAGGRSYRGYHRTTLAPAGIVTIAASGSSAACAGSGIITPAPAWAPEGKVWLIANGALADQYVSVAGIAVGVPVPPPPPDCSAAILAAVDGRDLDWRLALAGLVP